MLTPSRLDDRPAERVLARPACIAAPRFIRPANISSTAGPTCRLAAFEARQELKQRALFPELLEETLMPVPFE
jgi:hypothetical protein